MSNAEGVFNVPCNRRIDLFDLSSLIMKELDAHFPLQFKTARQRRSQGFSGRWGRQQEMRFKYNPEYSVKSGFQGKQLHGIEIDHIFHCVCDT